MIGFYSSELVVTWDLLDWVGDKAPHPGPAEVSNRLMPDSHK